MSYNSPDPDAAAVGTVHVQMSNPCSDPALVDSLHQFDCAPHPVDKVTYNHHSPQAEVSPRSSSTATPPSSSSSRFSQPRPTITPILSNKREHHYITESGSPLRVSSPLRQSISYPESPDHHYPFPNLGDNTADPASSPTTYTGGCRMALTGDRRGSNASFASSTRLAAPRLASSSSSITSTSPTTSKSPGASSPTASPNGAPQGFFASSMSALKGLTATTTAPAPRVTGPDDLAELNIEHTLHSLTSLTDRSTFSPAAFKNLQMVATGLLHKFQDAYIQRTAQVQELEAEREARDDEVSEAETKTQHLRMQLEVMAQRVAEQEEAMQALMAELKQERQLRLEEREENRASASGCSSVSEDLGVEEDQMRKWRKSAATSRSDTTYDTDEEGTEDASVFSRSRSPTLATTISDMGPSDASSVSPSSTISAPTKPSSLAAPPRISRSGAAQTPQLSTFQKLFRGVSAAEGTGPNSCQNCQGQDSSVAWDTVSLLKDENKGLKQRVGELEGVVDNALDAVLGLHV